MMPFEERWGIAAVKTLREWFGDWRWGPMPSKASQDAQCVLQDGTLAWKIACALQEAHDAGVVEALDPNRPR